MEIIAEAFILYIAIPLWMLAGIGDWWCHRATKIESSSGIHESILHSMQLAEMGLPIVAALLFEINALVLLVAITAWLIHDATALWDVTYAHKRRYLSPIEQHIHSFLELIPLFILILLCMLNREQLFALLGVGAINADFSLSPKQQPLAPGYLAAVFASVFFLLILPYGEELVRCYRGRKLATS